MTGKLICSPRILVDMSRLDTSTKKLGLRVNSLNFSSFLRFVISSKAAPSIKSHMFFTERCLDILSKSRKLTTSMIKSFWILKNLLDIN